MARHINLSRIMLTLFLLASCRETVDAQTYVHRYRFDPDASVLNISGGFAGFDLDYAIRGRFGLVINQLPGQPTTFGFSGVNAVLVGDGPFNNVSLNSILNMSQWEGTLSNPFTIDFTGTDNQHAPMRVAGTLGNVILLLNGSNRASCCDFFDYHLDAVTQIVSLNPSPGPLPADHPENRGEFPASHSAVPEPISASAAVALCFGWMTWACRRKV